MPDIDDLLAHRRKMNKPKKLGNTTTTQKVEEFDLIKEGDKLLGKTSPSSKSKAGKAMPEDGFRNRSKMDVSKRDASNSDVAQDPSIALQNEVQKTLPDSKSRADSHVETVVERPSSDTSGLSVSNLDISELGISNSDTTTQASKIEYNSAVNSDLDGSDSDLSDLERSVMDVSDLDTSKISISRSDVSKRDASELDASELDVSNIDTSQMNMSRSTSSVMAAPATFKSSESKSAISKSDVSKMDVSLGAAIEIVKTVSVEAVPTKSRAFKLDASGREHSPAFVTPSSDRSESDASEAGVSVLDVSKMDRGQQTSANSEVTAICANLINLAKSQLGLREIRAAIYLLAKAQGQKNVELQYTNPEISDATNCHTSHISGVMSALEEMGFLSKKRGKGNEKSSFTLR